MARLDIYEVLELVSEASTKKEKLAILTKNKSIGLVDVLNGTFNPNVQWLLPEGSPPFAEAPSNIRTHLDGITKNMAIFLKGQDDARKNKAKLEQAFINTLGRVHPKDAHVLIMMKDKDVKDRFNGLTLKLVQEAFPGLIKG